MIGFHCHRGNLRLSIPQIIQAREPLSNKTPADFRYGAVASAHDESDRGLVRASSPCARSAHRFECEDQVLITQKVRSATPRTVLNGVLDLQVVLVVKRADEILFISCCH